MTSGLAAAAVVAALLAQQSTSPYLGSVSKGTATAEPLKLSVNDAVQRALQTNLGLLLQEEIETTARRRALARARGPAAEPRRARCARAAR